MEQIIHFALRLREEDDERGDLAEHRRELLKSGKYVRQTGRTREEIDAEIEGLRDDRFPCTYNQ